MEVTATKEQRERIANVSKVVNISPLPHRDWILFNDKNHVIRPGVVFKRKIINNVIAYSTNDIYPPTKNTYGEPAQQSEWYSEEFVAANLDRLFGIPR